MLREYHHWHSPSLDHKMELLVFGHAGAPVLVFPTSMGRFYEYEDRGMVEVLRDRLENGWLQLFCVDSVDTESWYNYGAPGWQRMNRQNAYDAYLTNEVIPLIRNKNSNGFLITTGCSFGGYHATNFGLRHPEIVRKIVALSGRYHMNGYLDGFNNEDVYYNSPLDYIGGLNGSEYHEKLKNVETFLVAGEHDLPVCLNETKQLAHLLALKGIPHTLNIWGNAEHDWPFWREQITHFI